MAVDEQRLRQSLHARLAELVGADETALLMEYLPPVGWADVATKRDLDVFATELRSEMAVLCSDLRAEIAELRGELRGGLGELRGGLGELRGELGGELGELRGGLGELRGELRGEFKAQTTRLLLWLVPTVIAGMGVAARIG